MKKLGIIIATLAIGLGSHVIPVHAATVDQNLQNEIASLKATLATLQAEVNDAEIASGQIHFSGAPMSTFGSIVNPGGTGGGGGGVSTSTTNTFSVSQNFTGINNTGNVTSTSFTANSGTNSQIQTLNSVFSIPTNFASAGCFGSSTLTDFGGCVNYAYSLATASNTGIAIPSMNVSAAQWQTPIVFNINMVIPSLYCPGGARLIYGGIGKAVTFNFNVSSAHDVSQDWGCTYLGSSTVLAAGAANAATTTGVLFGGTIGSNAANGINFHDNTLNGFGTCADVATNTYMIAFDNNALSGCGSSANQPYPGSLLTVNKASNSGERMVFNQNSFTDPANSTSTNAVYLSDNSLASGFFTNNSFDDASIYVGISNGVVDIEENHFENAAYSTYLMKYFIIASSSGATNLNVNDNVFALDNTGSTGKLSEGIEEAVNLVFNGNIVENYGGASAITNFIDHTINAGQAVETACSDWSQNSAVSNWMQLTGVTYPGCFLESANGYPIIITANGTNVGDIINGQQNVATFDSSGNWMLLNNVTIGGTLNVTSTITGQAGLALKSTKGTFTTGSIGGGSLTAGTCASTTTALAAGITTSTAAFITTPTVDPGPDFYWETTLIASSSVSTRVCAAGITGTPNSSTYNVKIIQ